jgi:hypothetical protein
MEFMLIYSEPASEIAKAEDPAQVGAYFGAWKAYIGAMAQAGVMKSGHGLMPPYTATMVQVRGGKRLGQRAPAAQAYRTAIGLTEQPAIRVYLLAKQAVLDS